MSLTKYAIQRNDGYFWSGSNKWAKDVIGARWFESVTVAELTGLRDLHEPVTQWVVTAITQPPADATDPRRV